MAIDDSPCDGQSNPVPGVFGTSVKALKNPENPIGVCQIEADTVILHGESPQLADTLGADADVRAHTVPAIFQCVFDQVLKYSLQLGRGFELPGVTA